jgi:hypothetical protein
MLPAGSFDPIDEPPSLIFRTAPQRFHFHSDGIHDSWGRKDLIPVMKWFIVPRDETGQAFNRANSVF